MKTICSSLQKESRKVWREIKSSTRHEIYLQEESITDQLLLNLKQAHPRNIKIKKFNKIEESKLGSDWEWWIKDKGKKWIGIRIQAKRIDNALSNYAHLFYKKKNQYQIFNLIKGSIFSRQNLLPAFCLYTYFNQKRADIPRKHLDIPLELHGCSFLTVEDALKLFNNRRTQLEHVFPKVIPWHLPFCKGPTDNGIELTKQIFLMLKQGISAGIRYYSEATRKAFKISPTIFKSETYISEKPPLYVERLEKNLEIDPPDKELDHLLIYTEST